MSQASALPPSTTHTADTLCQLCLAMCPIKVDIVDEKVVKVWGDKNNPAYFGYTCKKGRDIPRVQHSPDRLLCSLKRQPDGSFTPIPVQQAIREIADRLRELIAKHGKRTVSMYWATGAFLPPASMPMIDSFMKAIGSPMNFSAATIDQPGKAIATALHGDWDAGFTPIEHADSWLMVGMNPPISKIHQVNNPSKVLHEAQKRGLNLVVIDPRRTEAARFAKVHLQPKPGEDPTVLAGMLHVILRDGLHDDRFIAEHCDGLEELRNAVEPFTPEYVAQRADIAVDDLLLAARTFAAGTRGSAACGTGPNMAPHGNVTEYLLRCLMSVCGLWPREGDCVYNPPVILEDKQYRAQPTPTMPVTGFGEKLRVRNLEAAICGMPLTALPDEILLEGEGQVKAMINLGGNPMMAWPDQNVTARALKALELLVVVDLRMTHTAQLADYIIAPKYALETSGLTVAHEWISRHYAVGGGLTVPFAMYSQPVLPPPPESDLVEDWEFLYLLARELELELTLPTGEKLDMKTMPTTDELIARLYGRGRVSLDAIRQYPAGHIFDDHDIRVLPKSVDCTARLQLGSELILDELAQIRAEPLANDLRFPFLMISRRIAMVYNSAGRELLKADEAFNPAYMNPQDMADLNLNDGDRVAIASRHGEIIGVAEADQTVRPGVISMAHCFGAAPGEDRDVLNEGSNTQRLTAYDQDYDRISGIPRMSAIPVSIRAS